MTEPTDRNADQSADELTPIQQERRDEAEQRNPDLHGQALEALEGEEDGSGRPLGG